jgi:hypothetical protein
MKEKNENWEEKKESDNVKHQDTGNQWIQFVAGFGNATAYTVAGYKATPKQKEFSCKERDILNSKIKETLKTEEVKQSPYAQNVLKTIKNQNNCQEYFKQPFPETKNVIDAFIAHGKEHAKIDLTARNKGKDSASDKKHAEIDIKHHEILSDKFKRAGYSSGYTLHKVGLFQANVRKELHTQKPMDMADPCNLQVTTNGM